MMLANVIASSHAVADGVGDIRPQITFDFYIFKKTFLYEFGRADFTGFLEQKPSIQWKPIFAAARYVIITTFGISPRLIISPLLLRRGDNCQIVFVWLGSNNNKELVSRFAIGKCEPLPMKDAPYADS